MASSDESQEEREMVDHRGQPNQQEQQRKQSRRKMTPLPIDQYGFTQQTRPQQQKKSKQSPTLVLEATPPDDPLAPWFLGEAMEYLLDKANEEPKWEDISQELSDAMTIIEGLLRTWFGQTGIPIISTIPIPDCRNHLDVGVAHDYFIREYARQSKHCHSLFDTIMNIERYAKASQHEDLLRIIGAQFGRIDQAIRLIMHTLNESSYKAEAPSRIIFEWNPKGVANKPKGLAHPPLPRSESHWRTDSERIEELKRNPLTHFVPIQQPADATEPDYEPADNTPPDSGNPPSPVNQELGNISSEYRSVVVNVTNDVNVRASSECSTSRESSPLTLDEVQKRQQWKADFAAIPGLPVSSEESPSRRVPSPPQAVLYCLADLLPPIEKSIKDFRQFLAKADDVKHVDDDAGLRRHEQIMSLLRDKTNRERERKEAEQRDLIQRVEGHSLMKVDNDSEMDEHRRRREQIGREVKEAKARENAAHQEFEQRRRERIAAEEREAELEQKKVICAKRKAEAAEKRKKEEKKVLDEKLRRVKEEEQNRAAAAAVERARLEEGRRQAEEEERRRKKEDEERRREEEERERVRREEEQRMEDERREAARIEAEKQRLLLDRETRKAEDRKRKEEEEERRRQVEEEKKRAAEEKRKEIAKRKLEEAASLEEKQKEADRKEAERRRVQREEDAERRRVEQRMAQAVALRRQEEELARQALSIAERVRVEEEQRKQKNEELQSAIESHQSPRRSPEQGKSKSSKRRARKALSRLQSTNSIDQADTRETSRERKPSESEESSEGTGWRDTLTVATNTASDIFQVAVSRFTKKKAEEVKFHAVPFVPVAPAANVEDKRAAEKRRAFEEKAAKEARRLEQLEREQREKQSREGTPKGSPKPTVWRKMFKKKEKPMTAISKAFFDQKKSDMEKDRMFCKRVYIFTFFVTLAIACVLAPHSTSFKLPTELPSLWQQWRNSYNVVNVKTPAVPDPYDDVLYYISDRNERFPISTDFLGNKISCLMWIANPGPTGPALCVPIPPMYHMAQYHDSTVLELADQESLSVADHLVLYELCEDRTGLKFDVGYEVGGGDYAHWFKGKWVDISKTEYDEAEAAIAYEMLVSAELSSCFDMLCLVEGKQANKPNADVVLLQCQTFTRVIARLVRIVYEGWGEEKLISHHKSAAGSSWFSLHYPYMSANTGARSQYVMGISESTIPGLAGTYELKHVTTVPLPITPRQYSETEEFTYIESFYKNLTAASNDWIFVHKTKVSTVRFDEKKAKRCAQINSRLDAEAAKRREINIDNRVVAIVPR